MPGSQVLLLEAFYGGTHKVLMDLLREELEERGVEVELMTMGPQKWHWRARTAALTFSQQLDCSKTYRTVFCSAVLNLAEFVGLCPGLVDARKILYFHENEFVYPKQASKERDFQYGYNQIISCLAADEVIFNSHYNMETFLSHVDSFLKSIPHHRPRGVASQIKQKSRVLYFPLLTSRAELAPAGKNSPSPETLQILWPHRWEHDKNPGLFFTVLFELAKEGVKFNLAVLGESYGEQPGIFEEARERLSPHIVHWGFASSSGQLFWEILAKSDVVVSTAEHETFGVAVLEAVTSGCYPLCPRKLVYPEIFPSECLYNTGPQLTKRLREFIRKPWLPREKRQQMDLKLDRFSWEETLKPEFLKLFGH